MVERTPDTEGRGAEFHRSEDVHSVITDDLADHIDLDDQHQRKRARGLLAFLEKPPEMSQKTILFLYIGGEMLVKSMIEQSVVW